MTNDTATPTAAGTDAKHPSEWDPEVASRNTAHRIEHYPATLEDLPSHDQRGSQVLSLDPGQLDFARVAKAATYLATFENSKGFIVERSYGSTTTVYLEPTSEEVDERVQRARERYDTQADQYDAVMATGGRRPDDYSARAAVELYCTRRGLPVPWVD